MSDLRALARWTPRCWDAVQEARADVATDAALATPIVVGHQRDLPYCLGIAVVNIDLQGLVDACGHDLYELINIVENGIRSAEQEVLERHQARVRRGGIHKDLEYSDAVVFSRVDRVKPDRRTEEAIAGPLPGLHDDLSDLMCPCVEHRQLGSRVFGFLDLLREGLLVARVFHLDAIDLHNEVEEDLQACLSRRAAWAHLEHPDTPKLL
mmetsp:Transcript_136970/g.381850  ORF Transcript_136970/g.381850 Transcript_136970/m.381850 type:complete len:209 (-) Transcript_136970:124-750(-)